MRRTALTMLTVTVVGLSAGCGILGPEEPVPDGGASSGTSATATPSEGSAPSDGVAAVGTLDRSWVSGTQVRFDVYPIETDGEHALLRYDFTATPDDPSEAQLWSTLALSLGGLGNTTTDGRGVRLFDTDAGLVHPAGENAGGPASTIERVREETDAETGILRGEATTVFAAPRGATVDVLIPRFGAVLDVPVVDAGDDFDDALDRVGGAPDTETRELRAFTRSYDEESVTSAEEDQVTVTLASDVLFASDRHTLSKKARGVVDRAARSIQEQADGGEVHVVGHTDDVDSDSYNQSLSERRAASVADRLRAQLGGGYTVSEEGRGESQPIAEGTSDTARAANRRVEIEFQGHLVVENDDAGTDIPDTDAPTVENEPVEISTKAGDYTIEVDAMVRRPGAIVGTLTATRTGGDAVDPAWFLPSYLKLVGDRNFGTLAESAGPHNLALLGTAERVLPFDYKAYRTPTGFQMRRLLGDEDVTTLGDGDTTTITLVWPDTGQDTVTVDAPDRFRITGVPVTDGTGD